MNCHEETEDWIKEEEMKKRNAAGNRPKGY